MSLDAEDRRRARFPFGERLQYAADELIVFLSTDDGKLRSESAAETPVINNSETNFTLAILRFPFSIREGEVLLQQRAMTKKNMARCLVKLVLRSTSWLAANRLGMQPRPTSLKKRNSV
jgi:hypothetical protein